MYQIDFKSELLNYYICIKTNLKSIKLHSISKKYSTNEFIFRIYCERGDRKENFSKNFLGWYQFSTGITITKVIARISANRDRFAKNPGLKGLIRESSETYKEP